MDEEAYKILASIKYSTAYLSLTCEQKEKVKGYMNRYESFHGISGGVEQQVQPDNGIKTSCRWGKTERCEYRPLSCPNCTMPLQVN